MKTILSAFLLSFTSLALISTAYSEISPYKESGNSGAVRKNSDNIQRSSSGTSTDTNPGATLSSNSSVNANGPFGVSLMDNQVPSNSQVLARGEIVRINRDNNTVTIRDAETGAVSVRSISDAQMLSGLNNGDSVQIYQESQTTQI